MSFEQNRIDLIENLTKAFKAAITTANMPKMYKNAGVKTFVLEKNGVDVSMSLEANAIFKPVFTDENYAKIDFNIVFKNCVFHEKSQGFSWGGAKFEIDCDFEYNLMFCRIDNKDEYDNPKWVLQDFEQNFTDDKKVSTNVISNVFKAMTKKELEDFGSAAFKIACSSNALNRDNGAGAA